MVDIEYILERLSLFVYCHIRDTHDTLHKSWRGSEIDSFVELTENGMWLRNSLIH